MISAISFPLQAVRRAIPLLVLTAISTISSWAMACSIRLLPYSAYDPQEYVFYGEVTEHVAINSANCRDEGGSCQAWGLKVKVLEAVSMPIATIQELEVFQFGLSSMCGATAMPRQVVEQTPPGSRVMVIGRLAASSPGTMPRVDASGYRPGYLVPLPPEANVAALKAGESEYFRTDSGKLDGAQYEFELRKDMTRLKDAVDERTRGRVLERLVYAHLFSQDSYRHDIIYRHLLREHLRDSSRARALLENREKFLSRLGMAYKQRRSHAEGLPSPDQAEQQFHYGDAMSDAIPQDALGPLRRAGKGGLAAADLLSGRIYETLSKQASAGMRVGYTNRARDAFKRAAEAAKRQAAQGDVRAWLLLSTSPAEMKPWLDVAPAPDQKKLTAQQCERKHQVSADYWAALGLPDSCLLLR